MGSAWEKWLSENKLDPELEKTMFREYSYLLYVAGLFFNVRPKIIIFSIAQSVLYMIMISIHMVLMTVTMFKATTFIGFSQYMNFASLCAVSLSLYILGLQHRNTIIRLLAIMSVDFYDYGDTFDSKATVDWKESLRKFKLIIVFGIPAYMVLIAVSLMFREYIDMALGYEGFDDDYKAGIYQKTPIPLWYPFKVTNDLQRIVVTLSQMLTAWALANSIGTGDVMMLFLGQTLALQLRILAHATHQLDDRARRMYEKNYKEQFPRKPLKISNSKKVAMCYRQSIRQLVEHHWIILEFYEAYVALIKWPTAMAFLNGSLVIAMSAIVAISGEAEVPSALISAAFLLIAEVVSMWLLCETGQHVNNWSEILYSSFYEFNWPDIPKSNKLMILILKEKIKQPMLLKAGGMTPVNRESFGTIMNTAYSYMNLMRASDMRK